MTDSQIFDADKLLAEPRILKIRGKEYKVPDLNMGTVLQFNKINRERNSEDFDFLILIDLIYLTLKHDNKINREEIESWGLKACVKFAEWLMKPLNEVVEKKSLDSNKEETAPVETSN